MTALGRGVFGPKRGVHAGCTDFILSIRPKYMKTGEDRSKIRKYLWTSFIDGHPMLTAECMLVKSLRLSSSSHPPRKGWLASSSILCPFREAPFDEKNPSSKLSVGGSIFQLVRSWLSSHHLLIGFYSTCGRNEATLRGREEILVAK